MAEPDLLPCPFCGAKAEVVLEEDREPDLWIVSCLGCIAHIEEVGKSSAIAAWNHRATSPAPDQTNAEVSDERLRIFAESLSDGEWTSALLKAYNPTGAVSVTYEQAKAALIADLGFRSITPQTMPSREWMRSKIAGDPDMETEVRPADINADTAADYIFDSLAKALGLKQWTPHDGSETWDGDVHATLMHLLRDAGVLDPETDAPLFGTRRSVTSQASEGMAVAWTGPKQLAYLAANPMSTVVVWGAQRGEESSIALYAAPVSKRVERLETALKPFSDYAGELFARNWNASDVVLAFDNPDDPHRVTGADFFAARQALQGTRS